MLAKNRPYLYIEPHTRQQHKDLFSELDSIKSKHFLEQIEDLEQIENPFIPLIIISEETNRIKGFDKLQVTSSYLIKIEEANLSMFSDNQDDFPGYLVKDKDDLVQSIEDISFFISLSEQNLKNDEVKKTQKYLSQTFSRKNIDKYNLSLEKIHELEKSLYETQDINSILELVQEYSNSTTDGDIKIFGLYEHLHFSMQKKRPYLSIALNDKNFLFLHWENEASEAAIAYLYTLLEENLKNTEHVFNSKKQFDVWNNLFSKITIPIVLFDEQGELVIQNTRFGQLGLSYKDCEVLADREQLTINGTVYRVLKNKRQERYNEYLFVDVDDFIVGSDNPSTQELGIISSSIAHEINNPLAGILAAIDYLLIDDLSEEIQQELKEMKKGIHRCKKLISTFLGFSQIKAGENREVKCLLKDCVDQAIELIRFRLIENNLQLQVHYKQTQIFERNLNPHILSMIIYLIFSDFVTHLSHHSLVVRKSHNQFEVEIDEKEDRFEMSFSNDVDLSSGQLKSKLMNHLLETINYKHFFEGKKLVLVLND